MKRLVFLCPALSAAVLLALMISSVTVAADNVIPNSSFQQAKDNQPEGWKSHTWAGTAQFDYAGAGRTDDRSVMIESTDGADASWGITVPVEPQSVYRLSGWIKTESVETKEGGRGALLNIHNLQPTATKALKGTQDWTRAEITFETGDADSLWINCLFGGWGNATGKAWFDDVQLERVSTKTFEPKVTIDASQKAEPMSKYIYGQFIEHLGRCIYGGIWAEMLQDRKFFDPVGQGESPWKPIGVVTMDTAEPFVGVHTPKLQAAAGQPAGIVQEALALRKGKTYVGRVWLRGDAPVRVSLVWGDGEEDRQTIEIQPTAEYVQTPLEFTAPADSDNARLEVVAEKEGTVHVGTLSLMPGDNVHGMRPDTLALLKELDSPVYRWPGGNFVSGYDWRDGIGDVDRRPPRKNPAWTGIEHNDFGMDEFMLFCKLLETEPYIAVNSGLGGVENAIAELEYANGAADTPMGKLRTENGHAEPYNVKWWGIGNEMYGSWQLGNIPLEDYIKKHNTFAKAFYEKDPDVQLVAVGAVGGWSEGMMQHYAEYMNLVSEHFYRGDRPGLLAHVRQIPESVHSIAEAHRDYRRRFDSLQGKDIRIALDEWNYWYGPHLYGELGTRYFLKDALGIAAGLNEFSRNTDIYFMANYAQTVNVIGCIKTTRTDAAFDTTGLVLKLYRQQFGTVPVLVDGGGLLDVAAALTADGKALTMAVVNPTMEPVDLEVTWKGLDLAGTGTRWEIAGDDPNAYNEPGAPPNVQIVESPVEQVGDKLPLAPCSITIFRLPLK